MSKQITGAIGDIHGRMKWKEIINKNPQVTKWVFIGDYFDVRNGGVSGTRQIEIFKEILALKQAEPNKYILLFGNHDFHYIRNIGEDYSGYQAALAHDIGEVIHYAIDNDLVQMCHLQGEFFFSHAGLTKTWCEKYLGTRTPNLNVLEQGVNDLFKYQPKSFTFMNNVGENMDITGDDVTQSPIWVRPMSLKKDMVDGIRCVVGHTQVRQLGLNDQFPQLILIDCLGYTDEYLIVEDGIAKIGN